MWRVGQSKNEISAGRSFTSILHATDRRTGFPAFLSFVASLLLLDTTSNPMITRAILQSWDGLCQQKSFEVAK